MSDGTQLQVEYRARYDRYLKDIDRVTQRTERQHARMRKSAEDTSKQMEKTLGSRLSGLGSAALAGGAAGIAGALTVGGLDQLRQMASETVTEIANIGSAAKRAGLDSTAFQELAHVARSNKVEIGALTDGMKELQLRADEFVQTGGGSAAESFQRLGYSADQLKIKLRNPADLFVEIIGKLEQLDKAAQIRISDELFGGTGGEQFVQLLDKGAEGIRRQIAQARQLGLIYDSELIAKAEEVDRKFEVISTTVSTKLKGAIVEAATALADFLDRFNSVEEQSTANVQSALTDTYDSLQAAKDRLAKLQDIKAINPANVGVDRSIAQQTAIIEALTTKALQLRDVLDKRAGMGKGFIGAAGDEAKTAEPPIENLNDALARSGEAGGKATAGVNSFAAAIRALSNEVPELAQQLADLDAKARIDAIHAKALSMATTPAEVSLANEMRGSALKAANVKSATDNPDQYLSTRLAAGKDLQHVTGLADDFAEKLAKLIASIPEDVGSISINSGYRSTERQAELFVQAVRKYGSVEEARKWVAPPGKSQHNQGMAADLGYSNDAAKNWAHQNASSYGLSFPLANESWHVEDASARAAQVRQEIEQLTTASQQQAQAYQQIIAGGREHAQALGVEAQAMTMTKEQAASLRFEEQLLAQARAAGIELTPQQTAEIGKLAQGMAKAEVAVDDLAKRQQAAMQLQSMLGNQLIDSFLSVAEGSMTAEQAIKNLMMTLARLLLQGALLGEGPLGGLFKGKTPATPAPAGGGGGGFNFLGLLGGLFGFADGGHTGKGGKYEPAGVVHRDEYVFNKRATNRLGVRNLEALHQAANGNGKLPGFADGGFVGRRPSIPEPPPRFSRPELSAAPSEPSQSIEVNAPITVTVQGASSGNPEQDAAFAKRISREIEASMRGVIAQEIAVASRPGNRLNNRRM